MRASLGRVLSGLRHLLAHLGRVLFFMLGLMFGISARDVMREGTNGGPRAPVLRERLFSPEVLRRLADARSVTIETRKTPIFPPYRAAIMPVVDGEGGVYARCAEGEKGDWYRRVLINRGVMLHAEGGTIRARAVPSADGRTIAHVTGLYRRKYGPDSPETHLMVREDVETTTVRFHPF